MTFAFKGTLVCDLDLDPKEYAGLSARQTVWAIQELLQETEPGAEFDLDDVVAAADALMLEDPDALALS